MHESLPSFRETGELPAFGLLPNDADRTTQYRPITADDLELVEDSTPRSIAPIALESSELEDDIDEISISEVLEEEPRRRWPWVAFAATAMCAAAFAMFSRGERRSFLAESWEEPKPPPVIEAPPPPPPPVVVAPPPAPVIAKPLPTKGTIVAPNWTRGRRVWLDGKPVSGHAPKVEVACGKHSLKIGAYSKTKQVDIPCGGEIKVTP